MKNVMIVINIILIFFGLGMLYGGVSLPQAPDSGDFVIIGLLSLGISFLMFRFLEKNYE